MGYYLSFHIIADIHWRYAHVIAQIIQHRFISCLSVSISRGRHPAA